MFDILGTNLAWVSSEGFIKFCKNLSKLENWEDFTREQVTKLYSTATAFHKVRSNLNFMVNLGLINQINGHYKVNEDSAPLNFFHRLSAGKKEESFYFLSKVIDNHPLFNRIFNEFFFDKHTKTIKELKEFLRIIDNNHHKLVNYHNSAKFFSKLLSDIGMWEYNQRSHTISLKDEDKVIQKKLTEEIQIDSFNEVLNEIVLLIRNINNNEDLAKIINALPEEKRLRITSKLLGNIRKK